MFGQIMSNLQLTSPAADEIFKNCAGDSFRNDSTFLAVLRTIVVPRMKQEDSLHLTVTDVPSSSYDADCSGEALLSAIFASGVDADAHDRITVVNLQCSFQKTEETIGKIDDAALTAKGFELDVTRVTYIKQQAKSDAKIYRNPQTRAVLVIVANLSVIVWHLVAASVCKLLPWFFVERPPRDDPEVIAVLNSIIMQENPNEFRRLMAEAARKYDFRSAGIRKQLEGFERKYDEDALRRTKESAEQLRRSIAEYYEAAAQKNRELHEKLLMVDALEDSIANGGSNELMEYFLMNKHLELMDTGSDWFEFAVGDYYIDMWDEDAATLAIEKTSAAIYRHFSGREEKAKAKKFFKACFQDETIRIKVCAAYRIYSYGGCEARGSYDYPDWMRDCSPNPHTEYYSCLGGHKSIINQACNAGNYVSAVEQCCASARNLNFSDSTVMSSWSDHFFDLDKHCVELPDGSCVTPMEAVEWAAENVQ